MVSGPPPQSRLGSKGWGGAARVLVQAIDPAWALAFRLCLTLASEATERLPMARILIVDDEVGLADLIRTILEEEGHALEAVYTGQAALDLITTHDYDLIICDVRLPDVDGFAICRAIEQRAPPQPAVLLMTGQAEGFAYAADFPGVAHIGVFSKPVGVQELRGRVRDILDARR